MRRLLAVLSLLALPLPAALAASPAPDPAAARTIVLVNASQPESVALGEFYLEQRGIPEANLVALPMPEEETITWHRFVDEVWQPLQDELARRGWLQGTAGPVIDQFGRKVSAFREQRLAYLVVCRGTPLRVENDPLLLETEKWPARMAQFHTNQCAVDSELSLLAVGNHDINGLVPNPLFSGNHPEKSPAAGLIIKVARLDGPTDASARHLVTSALTAERQGLIGRYYVDLMPVGSPSPDGDTWLSAAREQLESLGFDGDTDREPGTLGPSARFDAPAIYAGWYAGQVNGPFLRAGFVFPPGAIAEHIHSYSASTLRSDHEGWCGPLVARGVAATVGNVYEPYLQMLHRPDLLLQALAQGRTLGEAAYYALPFLSWQSVVIGDPLYRPFRVPLEEQGRHLAELPPGLAPYVVIREARLLDLAGRHEDAAAMRLAGLRRFDSLPLELAHTEAALALGRPARLIELAGKVAGLPSIGEADWPLVRQAARLLNRGGAIGPALATYRRLIDALTTSASDRLHLLAEARQVAKAAGDNAAEQEFARREAELRQPAAAPAPGK